MRAHPSASLPQGTARLVASKIEDCQVKPGERWGPCALYVANRGGPFWMIGCWDGEDWYGVGSGLIVSPTHFALLPDLE